MSELKLQTRAMLLVRVKNKTDQEVVDARRMLEDAGSHSRAVRRAWKWMQDHESSGDSIEAMLEKMPQQFAREFMLDTLTSASKFLEALWTCWVKGDPEVDEVADRGALLLKDQLQALLSVFHDIVMQSLLILSTFVVQIAIAFSRR